MKEIFAGIGVALVTPFCDGEIDYKALDFLIEKSILDGATAIVLLATTGEGVTINENERKKIISKAKNKISNRAKLIVGTGSNNFQTAVKNTQMAKELGADACLVVTPYYNKTSKAGIVEYYRQLSDIGVPLIAYNVPARTGCNLPLETIKTLIEENLVVGIKESTTDIERIIELTRICKDKIAVYSGEDDLNFLFYCLGASGAISVTANLLTRHCRRLFDFVKTGELEKARELDAKLSVVNKALFCETNPIPVKALLNKLGYIKNELRMPLVPLSKENETRIEIAKNEVQNLGL